MIKDHIRDYATSAFRLYALHEKPTYDQLRQRLYDEALRKSKREIIHLKGVSNPTQTAIQQAEVAVEKKKAELLDVLAVGQVISSLGTGGRSDIIQALELVYFYQPERELKRGDISDRVHVAELCIPASESSIYRWLKQARQLFAIERGLRI